MFEFIIGDIVSIQDEYVVIQNNGIGYKILTSTNSMIDLELGQKDKMLYTDLNVREDGLYLYGFTTEEELDMFKLLLKVSKIGPKTGLAILSTMTPNQIKLAIHNKDINTLCKAPGIGKKTAERMILELKDKIGEVDNIDTEVVTMDIDDHNEAVEALMTLGYSKYEAEKAINSMNTKDMTVEAIIREALKKLSRN